MVFSVTLVYFRIKNWDKLDLLFYIINFLCIMPISIILNFYGYMVLLYLYIPFIICSSNIIKDKIKGKNVKYIIYFIQFILIIIFMIIIRSIGPIVFVYIFNYFESEYVKLFMTDSVKSSSKNTCKVVDKLGYFICHSERDIDILKETDMLNKEYYEYCSKVLDFRTLSTHLSYLNRTNFENLFGSKENLIKLKFIFDITTFHPNTTSPGITASFPFLAKNGNGNGFRPNESKIYISAESKNLLKKTIELKSEVLMNLAMQVYFGIFDLKSNIVLNSCDSWSLNNTFKRKFPPIHAEYFRIQAIKNNVRPMSHPNIYVWEYLNKLGMANFSNTDFIDLDLAKSRMEDYYNNNKKGVKRSIDMVEQPTTAEGSKRRKL